MQRINLGRSHLSTCLQIQERQATHQHIHRFRKLALLDGGIKIVLAGVRIGRSFSKRVVLNHQVRCGHQQNHPILKLRGIHQDREELERRQGKSLHGRRATCEEVRGGLQGGESDQRILRKTTAIYGIESITNKVQVYLYPFWLDI